VNLVPTESPFRTFARLWKRAPVWRLSGMFAAVLTLLFVLFFNKASDQPEHALAATSGQTSYLPQPSSEQSDKSNSIAPPPGAGSSTTAPDINKQSMKAVASGSKTQTQPTSLSASPKVQTANLSLAVPGEPATSSGDIDSALGGRTYSGSVSINGYKVPLPTGNWVILSSAHYKSPIATGELVFLAQVKNRRLIQGARVFALRSAGQSGNGFPPKLKGCVGVNRNALYVASEAEDADGHQACWLVASFFTPPLQQWADRAIKIDALDRAAAGDLAAKGVTYPQDFIRLRMTRTETWGLLEVSYLFSPEAAGIKSNDAISVADTDWTPENVSRYPEKVAYVEKMKQWGMQFWPGFKAAFDAGATK
jgi:hypothetical protein